MTIESPGNNVKDIVFLGENVTNAEYVQGLVRTADFINDNILHATDNSDRKKSVVTLISASKKYKSVEEVETDIGSNNSPDAKMVRDFVADGLLLAMRDGGDSKYSDALMTGQVDEIEKVLPDELKVWAREVRNRFIDNTDITAILDQVYIDEYSLSEERTKMLQIAGRALNALKGVPKEQLELAKNAIRAMFANEANGEGGGGEKTTGKTTAGAGKGEGPARGLRRGGYDDRVYGQPEGMERVAPIPIPEDALDRIENVNLNMESAKSWAASTLVRMSENPLFFANWWQQGVADQITTMLCEKLGYSSYTKEFAEIRDYNYAVLSVLGMQAVDRNADANSDNYGQFAPPKGMAAVLHWDDGGKNFGTLKEDETVVYIFRKVFATAFDEANGWKIVQAYSDGTTYGSQNDYLSGMLGDAGVVAELGAKGVDVAKEKELLMAKGRVALAMFEVDWIPEWIRWVNESRRAFAEGRQNVDLPWLQAFGDAAGIRNPHQATFETYAYSGTLKSKVGVREYEIGYDHPRVLRPWDVAAGAKGSYRSRPEIIWAMDRLLSPFIARRLSTKDGRWVTASGADIKSANVLDRYAKYGKFMFELMGGPNASEFDNLTTLEKVTPLAANFWGPGVDRNPEFGVFLADLFALKTEAMFFPGYKSNAKATLAAIGGLDVFSGEMEKKKALEGAIGPGANTAHGWVAEAKRLYGIDLLANDDKGEPVYPAFVAAYVRVFMDTPDLNEAVDLYNKARGILVRKQFGTVVSGGFAIIKGVTGMK